MDERDYRFQVPVEVEGVASAAMVDSGNTWRTAISTAMANRMGLKSSNLRPVPGVTTVQTAKSGDGLRLLGETRKLISIRIGEHPTAFKCRPVVLDGLSMAVNLSGPFLRKNGINQLHTRNALSIGRRIIPMMSQMTVADLHQGEVPVYVEEKVVLPPRTHQIITLRVPGVIAMQTKAGQGLVMADERMATKFKVHPWRPTVVCCDQNGRVSGGVMNTGNTPVVIPAGARYGMYAPINNEDPGQAYHIPVEQGHRRYMAYVKAVPSGACQKLPAGHDALTSRGQKIRRIIEQFGLDTVRWLKRPTELAQAVAVLLPYYDMFAWTGQVGHTDLLQHDIELEPGNRPINCRYRPLNPIMEADLRRQIDTWLKLGVIEAAQSPWNFCLVAAPKKSSPNQYRWCIDYRRLNDITVKDVHPIGNIDDNLVRLARSKIFSALDGAGAYHVIDVASKDKEKTAFSTPFGQFQFRRLPFGLTNAPSVYARLVKLTLEGIPTSEALPYLDDVLVHTATLKEHFTVLTKVLAAHRRAGLMLQPSKCKLFQESVEYLGHVISAEGIAPPKDYVKIVQDWPCPTTRTQVRAFLGKTGYYRKFIANYTCVARPLLERLVKDDLKDHESFKPTAEMKNSVDNLKKMLLTAPILAYPRFDLDEPFILDTDWSQVNNAVGGVLSQVQSGRERVIAYAAKRLSKTQAGYSSMKGELAAVILLMEHWRYYLAYDRFLLRVDNSALQWIRSLKNPTGMIARWLECLAEFNFTVTHRIGKSHGNADSLSRAEHIPANDGTTEVDEPRALVAILPPTGNQCWEIEDWRLAQRLDPELRAIIRFIEDRKDSPDLAPDKMQVKAASSVERIYWGMIDQMRLNSNLVLEYAAKEIGHDGKTITRRRLVVPRQWWEEALAKAHEAGGHMAAENTVERAQRFVYFPQMRPLAEYIVRKCQPCQIKAGPPKQQRHTLVSHVVGYPFRTLSIDFVGPLPASRRGSVYILTVLDTFTKWLEAFPIKKANTETVVRLLTEQMFARYGLCETIHSDRGTPFVSGLMKEVAAALGVHLTVTPAYNPRSNPVERQHRTLQKAIVAVIQDDPRGWEDALPQVLFALRTTVSRMTRAAPYQLLFGREASTSLELLFGLPKPEMKDYDNEEEYVRALRHRVNAAHAWARNHMAQAVVRQRRAYHKDQRHFEVNTPVWLFTPRLKPGQSKKFATFWTGPWHIEKRVNELMYEIRPDSTWMRTKHEIVSVDRLKQFYPEELGKLTHHPPPSVDADLRMAGDEFAEHVTISENDSDDDDDDDDVTPMAQEMGDPQPDAPQAPLGDGDDYEIPQPPPPQAPRPQMHQQRDPPHDQGTEAPTGDESFTETFDTPPELPTKTKRGPHSHAHQLQELVEQQQRWDQRPHPPSTPADEARTERAAKRASADAALPPPQISETGAVPRTTGRGWTSPRGHEAVPKNVGGEGSEKRNPFLNLSRPRPPLPQKCSPTLQWDRTQPAPVARASTQATTKPAGKQESTAAKNKPAKLKEEAEAFRAKLAAKSNRKGN